MTAEKAATLDTPEPRQRQARDAEKFNLHLGLCAFTNAGMSGRGVIESKVGGYNDSYCSYSTLHLIRICRTYAGPPHVTTSRLHLIYISHLILHPHLVQAMRGALLVGSLIPASR